MSPQDLPKFREQLTGDMAKRLRIRSSQFSKVVKHSRPYLSNSLVRDLGYVEQAEQMSGSPKLARQIDYDRLVHADRQVRRVLKDVNVSAERERRIFGLLVDVALKLAAVVAAFVAVVVWRDLF